MNTACLTLSNIQKGTILFSGRSFNYTYVINHSSYFETTVLLGGVLQDMASWKNYVAEFSKTNNVLTIDLPGVGSGGVLESEIGFDFLADCLNVTLVKLSLSKINIFSTSYSTIIAFEFAKKYHQKVNALVISSSMTHVPAKQKTIMLDCVDALEEGDLTTFGEIFFNGITNSESPARNYDLAKRVIASGIQKMNPTQVQQFIENTKRVLAYTPEITTKITLNPLIFTGELDDFTPPHLCHSVGHYFEAFDFRIIPQLDHLFHIGNNNLIFSTIIPYLNYGSVPDFGFHPAKSENNLVKAA